MRPIFRTLNQIGTKRVAFDVPANRQEMGIIFDREALEGPLIHVPTTARSIVGVITKRVGRSEPSAEPPHRAIFLRAKDEMPMIVHQAKGKQVDGVFVESFTQGPQECYVVVRLVEDWLTVVSAIDGVIDHARFIGTFLTRHHRPR
jgi:hypothetical protein